MTQNLKIRTYLMQHFMELDMEKILGTKTLTRGVWSVKTILGQFGLKAYGGVEPPTNF